jgi:hypothetical protein
MLLCICRSIIHIAYYREHLLQHFTCGTEIQNERTGKEVIWPIQWPHPAICMKGTGKTMHPPKSEGTNINAYATLTSHFLTVSKNYNFWPQSRKWFHYTLLTTHSVSHGILLGSCCSVTASQTDAQLTHLHF